MKTLLPFALCMSMSSILLAQHMNVKAPNFTSFNEDIVVSSALQSELTSAKGKEHPEYGILPYNAPCNNCFELIDKRTETTRLFIDLNNEGHTYSQQSYLPVSYKDSPNGVWKNVDHRLKPIGNNIYEATNQPVPTKLDLGQQQTSLKLDGFEFAFNKNSTLRLIDSIDGIQVNIPPQAANYSNYTVGEEGLKVYNVWPGIDMQQEFRTGEVEATYIIRQPLKLPVATGYMVIEDHFTLPAGYTFTESPNGIRLANGHFQGDYELRDIKGELLAIYSKPVYFDTRIYGTIAAYELVQKENDYSLKMFIPIEWLTKEDNVYPIYIDPSVYGVNKLGNYYQTGLAGADMGFTSEALGSCNYHLNVSMPPNNIPVNTYVELEYRLMYDMGCGNPPLPAPFCTFTQVGMEVLCDSCGTTSGRLGCRPTAPPFTGTCTTDSNLVGTAGALSMDTITPDFVTCFPYQTTGYSIDFTLKNTDSICGDVCGYLCARGTMWRMTVEARNCPDSTAITQHGDTLFCYTSNGIQWYLNDTLLPGAILPFLVATQSGIYSAVISDNVGCISPSYPYTFTTNTGLQKIVDNPIRIFPNPANNSVTVSLPLGIIQSIQIKDITGREVFPVNIINKPVAELNVSALAKGCYLIEIKTGNEIYTKRLLKQ